MLFSLQNSQQIYFYLYHATKAGTNEPAHIRGIANVICLLALEFGEAEVIVEIVGFVFGLQVCCRVLSHLLRANVPCARALIHEKDRQDGGGGG